MSAGWPTCRTRTRTSAMLSLGVPSVPLGGRQAARADRASIALAVLQRVRT